MHPARGGLLDLPKHSTFAGDGRGWGTGGLIHRVLTAPPAAALLIRPDGYVAWAASPARPATTACARPSPPGSAPRTLTEECVNACTGVTRVG